MTSFAYVGPVPASKSLLNRLLITKSYFHDLELHGVSRADDVQLMQAALGAFDAGKNHFEIGRSATGLRLLALRVSRNPGRYVISGHETLFARPTQELLKVLFQLGVGARVDGRAMEIHSQGWKMHGDMLLVPFSRSSQFATAVLMNAWNLDFDLFISLGGQKVSEGYWRMSLQLAQDLGMRVESWDGDIRIPAGQKINVEEYKVESDVSSVFALACVAAVAGDLSIVDFPESRMQPDVAFLEIFHRMGIPVSFTNGVLKVDQAKEIKGIQVDLHTTPDLFPGLAVLCGLAEGESRLYGAPHLRFKESDRLDEIAGWLKIMGREVITNDDGVLISGKAHTPPEEPIELDSRGDHRLAFAAAILKAKGWPIRLVDSDVVSKSFPEFWEILGWRP